MRIHFIHRVLAVLLVKLMLLDIAFPTLAWALTGGSDEGRYAVYIAAVKAYEAEKYALALSLAERISCLHHLPPVQSDVDHYAPPDSYVADPEPFLEALARYGLSPSGLDRQLRDTAAGLMEQGSGTLG